MDRLSGSKNFFDLAKSPRYAVRGLPLSDGVIRMSADRPKEVTGLLRAWSEGDPGALDRLMPLVYDELRKIAESYLRRERHDHTLQPTALLHEAYLRLVDQSVQAENRHHFYGIAAQVMRRILVDHARADHAAKRGGGGARISLDEIAEQAETRQVDLVALDDALKSLAAFDPQQARIVELRYFGGLTIEEVAALLNLSPATIKREWHMARAWLKREIEK